MSYKINGRLVVDAPPGFPRAFKGEVHKGKVYEYILIASQILGRVLLPEEEVHHRDGNCENNSPSNLLVLATKSDHAILHKHNCDESILIKQDNGAYHVNPDILPRCPICGKRLVSYSIKMCRDCRLLVGRSTDHKYDSEGNIIGTIASSGKPYPTKKELTSLVEEKPATQIAAMYGVSNKAIAKWCKKYGIKTKPSGYWAKQRANKNK